MTQRATPPLPFSVPLTAASVPSKTPALPFVAPVAVPPATALPFAPAPKAGKRAEAVQPSLFAQPPELQEATVLVASIRPNVNLRNRDVLDSVGVIGVTQPILITPIEDPHYLYAVVAGGRRLHSALHFKLDEIKVNVTGGTPAQLAMLRAVENGARSSNPVAEARAYQEAMKAGVYASERALAKDMGLDVQLVVKRLKLAGLPDDILEAVDEGRLSCPNAERIVKLKGEYRDRAFKDVRSALAEGRKFTGDDLKNVKTRQKGDMSAVLGGLLSAVPATAMQPMLSLSPAQLLAEEFRAIAQERGVQLAEVVALLSSGVTSPAHAQPVPVATSSTEAASCAPVLVASVSAPAARPNTPLPFARAAVPQALSEAMPTPPAQFTQVQTVSALGTAPVTVSVPVRAPMPFMPATSQPLPAVEMATPQASGLEATETEVLAVDSPTEDTEPQDDGYGVQTSSLLALSGPSAPMDTLGLLGTDRPDDGANIQEMPWPGFEEGPSEPEARGPSLDDLSNDPVLDSPVDGADVSYPHQAPLQAEAAGEPDGAPAIQDVSAQAPEPEQAPEPTAPETNLLGISLNEIELALTPTEDDLPWPEGNQPDAVSAAETEHAQALSEASQDFIPEFVPFIEKSDNEADDDGTVLRRVPTRVNLHAATLGNAARSQAAAPPRRTNIIPPR